uniref:Clc-like protein n=1 Tax=Onchocerca volvulus TaxID=6282 RepID=A0A8R1XX06_ONCVO
MVSARSTLQIPSFIIALIGTIINFVALATPAWQVVYVRELQQWIQSGLWMNCQTRPSGMISCTYTFTKNDIDFYTNPQVISIRTPAFYEWQHILLYILLFGQFLALFAMICFCYSQSADAGKSAQFLFTIAIGLSALINIGCNIAFQVFAHMLQYRFYHVSVSGIYEKHVGYSYFLHLIDSILLVLSFMFSLAYIIMLYRFPQSTNSIRTNQNVFSPYQIYQDRHSQEDFFAMRALPELPSEYRK